MKRSIAVILAGATLSGCVASHQEQGSLIGGALGALVGNGISNGDRRIAAVAAGSIGGAFLGSKIGQTMDAVKVNNRQAQQYAPSNPYANVCSNYVDRNVVAACHQGASERFEREQQRLIYEAYQAGLGSDPQQYFTVLDEKQLIKSAKNLISHNV